VNHIPSVAAGRCILRRLATSIMCECCRLRSVARFAVLHCNAIPYHAFDKWFRQHSLRSRSLSVENTRAAPWGFQTCTSFMGFLVISLGSFNASMHMEWRMPSYGMDFVLSLERDNMKSESVFTAEQIVRQTLQFVCSV
jgi:hypothetical protein